MLWGGECHFSLAEVKAYQDLFHVGFTADEVQTLKAMFTTAHNVIAKIKKQDEK